MALPLAPQVHGDQALGLLCGVLFPFQIGVCCVALAGICCVDQAGFKLTRDLPVSGGGRELKAWLTIPGWLCGTEKDQPLLSPRTLYVPDVPVESDGGRMTHTILEFGLTLGSLLL